MFKVTIKGSGESTVDLTTRTWSVDRTYESDLIELNQPGPLIVPNMKPEEYQAAMFAPVGTSNVAKKAPIHVTINDALKLVTTEVCPSPKGNYKETTTISRTWVGKGDVRPELAMGIARLQNSNHYNVFIPLASSERSGSPLVYTEVIDITGKPSKKVIENRTLSSVNFPKVRGLLDYPAIRHSEEQPIDVLNSKFGYDSKDLAPSEPIFPEIRESKFQVKVRVRYQWATGPFTKVTEVEW